MNPIDANGNEWPAQFSRAKLKAIRTECVLAMRAQDEQRSGGRLCEASGYRPYTVIADKKRGGRYTPETDLVLIRHRGQDTRKLLAGKWAAFCSEPQDLDAWKRTHQASSRAEELNRLRDFAGAKDALAEAQDGSPELPARRGPGRPRKIREDAETVTAP